MAKVKVKSYNWGKASKMEIYTGQKHSWVGTAEKAKHFLSHKKNHNPSKAIKYNIVWFNSIF